MGHSASRFSPLGRLKAKGMDGLGLKTPFEPPQKETLAQLQTLLQDLSPEAQFNSLGETLVAAYFLGRSPKELAALYEDEMHKPPQWSAYDSEANAREQERGQSGQYHAGFLEYFANELRERKSWKKVVRKSEDLIFEGLWHYDMRAFIHLGCATEIDHPEMAMQALAMAAWAAPEDVPKWEAPRCFHGELLYILEKAVRTGGVTVRAAAAACEMVYGRRLLDYRRLYARLALEVRNRWKAAGSPDEIPEPTNDVERRATRIVQECLARCRTEILDFTAATIIMTSSTF